MISKPRGFSRNLPRRNFEFSVVRSCFRGTCVHKVYVVLKLSNSLMDGTYISLQRQHAEHIRLVARTHPRRPKTKHTRPLNEAQQDLPHSVLAKVRRDSDYRELINRRFFPPLYTRILRSTFSSTSAARKTTKFYSFLSEPNQLLVSPRAQGCLRTTLPDKANKWIVRRDSDI